MAGADPLSIKRTIDLYDAKDCPITPGDLSHLSWAEIHRALCESPAFRSTTYQGQFPIVDVASTVIDTLVDLGWDRSRSVVVA